MIYLLGDVHSNFRHVIEIVRKDRPKAVIFLGDLECSRPLHEEVASIRDLTDVWWIPGNHDTDSAETYRNLFESELADRNLHGRVVEIAGIRVAGLGGVFRGKIWSPPAEPEFVDFDEYQQKEKIGDYTLSKLDKKNLFAIDGPKRLTKQIARDGRLLKHRSSIFYSDFINLYGQSADIIVTHEAPSCHPHGFAEIDALAQSLHVKFAYHGHHHDCLNYRAFDAKFGFQAFGVGFCGVTDMFGGMIVPGSFDEARRYRQKHPEGAQ